MKDGEIKVVSRPDKMISYWKSQWKVVLLIVITGTVFNASMSLGPILQGEIIDLLIKKAERSLIIREIVIFVGVILAIQFMRYLKRYYVRVFANRTSATMRMMVYNNITNRDISELKNEKTGDLMTKAISDVGACVEGMRKFTTEIFDTGILMLFYFINMLRYDIKLTIASCLFIPGAMYIAERLKGVIYKYSKSYRKQLSKVSELTYENINNTMLYRINSIEGATLKKYDDELNSLEKKAILANMLENSMQPIYNAISLIGVIFIVNFGGRSVLDGSLSIGEFSAYITIFSAIAFKASKAAKLFNSVQKADVSWKRIKPYLTEYQTKEEVAIEKKLNTELKVDKMSFSYPNMDRDIVRNVSFHGKTGEIIGITGPIASGKSTIGVALQGLFPYKGSIKINSRELRDYMPFEISKRVSYMSHDSQLLSDTIYNNITLGKKGDINRVLKDVCFDIDLKDMPDGVNTVVGSSGIRLSGGQQSRLSLARTLYNKSDILVLDDPFSAVDMKTEHIIIENLRKNYSDCIIILISHRISCFEGSDRVVLVNRGKSLCGTHKELMESSKVYRAIFSLQGEEQCYEA